MDDQAPPQYVGYHRPNLEGDPRKLELLRDAYFKCYWVMLSTLIIQFGSGLILAMIQGPSRGPMGGLFWLIYLGLLYAINPFILYRYAAMVAEVKGKGKGYAVLLTSIGVLLTPCCIGAFGCGVIQHAATGELKKYGLQPGLFGIKRADIQIKINQMRMASQMPPMAPIFDVQPTTENPDSDNPPV